MIDAPYQVNAGSFQDAWLTATKRLRESHWAMRNLVVQVTDAVAFDAQFHDRISHLARDAGILGPKHVAYTIFPHGLQSKCNNAKDLYARYNCPRGLRERLVRRSRNRWGTYFGRLTDYPTPKGAVNQLDNIIKAIRSDPNMYTAAFTMITQKPGGETTRRLGGPCLNYIAVQLDQGPPPSLGLLCVYRNHDFLERAYGNYWGLCNLLVFMAQETNLTPGPLTCVSSRAYVDKHKVELNHFLDTLP